MRIAIGQFGPTDDKVANLAAIELLCHKAARGGAALLCLPEASMFPFSAEAIVAAEPLDGEFTSALAHMSAKYSITILCGVFELCSAEGKVSNTIVLLRDGLLAGNYRKVHLVDALGWTESSWFVPGDPAELLLFEVGGYKLGVATCYDLRFPEIFRSLAERGAEVLLVPAAWAPGPLKEDHWLTLLRARAIENTAYVIGAAQPAPLCAGHSAAIDPMGVVMADAGEEPNLLFADIASARLETTRVKLPVLANRRYAVLPKNS